MLRLQGLSLRRGGKLLFANADLAIHPGHRVGVVGANGTGKSSLFALIRGELLPDSGILTMPPDWTIAHVAQETPAVDVPAIDYVLAGDRELRQIEEALVQAESAGDGVAQARLHAQLDAIDGYTARARAAKLLQGLGFAHEAQMRPVAAFSGGWRMRLNLAQALMCRSDLLLLDEPTNHLDLDAVLWLEGWLSGYPGTLLLISHDRDFLDAVATHIVHLGGGSLTLATGNFSTCEQRRAEQMAQQQAAYSKQQAEVARMTAFVERFRAKATKARQAQSRLKALERMQRIAPIYADSPLRFAFLPSPKTPSPLLRLDEVAIGYQAPVLEAIKFALDPGDRIGLLGANGAGKSTLIKLLAAELRPLAGSQYRAPGLRIGYFAQHQIEQLDLAASPLLHLQRLDPVASEQSLRDYLGGFGFAGEQALSPTAPLSGGEKARLVLALLIYRRPNLLLLDEPTNHLDMAMRHALAVALQDFGGALVLVSHDRALLRAVTDRFVLVANGRVLPFAGDLEDYRRQLLRGNDGDETAGGKLDSNGIGEPGDRRKQRRRDEAVRRERLKPLQQAVARCEQAVTRLETARNELDQRLGDTALYTPAAKAELTACLAEQGRICNELAAAEAAWLAAEEALAAAEETAA